MLTFIRGFKMRPLPLLSGRKPQLSKSGQEIYTKSLPIRLRMTPNKSFRCLNSRLLVPPHVSVYFFRNNYLDLYYELYIQHFLWSNLNQDILSSLKTWSNNSTAGTVQ